MSHSLFVEEVPRQNALTHTSLDVSEQRLCALVPRRLLATWRGDRGGRGDGGLDGPLGRPGSPVSARCRPRAQPASAMACDDSRRNDRESCILMAMRRRAV